MCFAQIDLLIAIFVKVAGSDPGDKRRDDKYSVCSNGPIESVRKNKTDGYGAPLERSFFTATGKWGNYQSGIHE
jgi:hypothetical protein